MKKNQLLFSVLFVFVTVLSFVVLTSASATAKQKVKIGGIMDITGPTNTMGAAYANGALTYFEMLNEKGGINGRQIDYIQIDYGYKLPRAMAAYKRLVSQQKIIALVGWGTGDTKARIPLCNRDKIPQIAATRTEEMVVPISPYNYIATASYADEVRIWLQYISKHTKIKGRKTRVAYVSTNAEYGRSPFRKAKKEKLAQKLGLELVDFEIIPQSATEVTSQVLNLKKAKPDYVFSILTTAPQSVFLKDAYKAGLKTDITIWSGGGAFDLLKLVRNAGKGVSKVSLVVYQKDSGIPALKTINRFIDKRHPGMLVNSVFVRGWLNAMIMAEGIRLAGDNLSGEGVKKGLESIRNFDTGGITQPISFSPTNHIGTTGVIFLRSDDAVTFKPITGWITKD